MTEGAFTLDPANVAGLIGSAITVAAYGYSNLAARLNLIVFNAMMLVGSVLLIASLTVHFNVAAMAMEVIWAVIAVFGLAKGVRQRRAA